MANNAKLHAAKKAKNDEFYTQFEDIQKELSNYPKEQFEDQIVLCNCDDPFESNFIKYFILKFNDLKLKKLVGISYKKSPIANTELRLYNYEPKEDKTTSVPHKIEITNVPEWVKTLDDAKEYIEQNRLVMRLSYGENGDFRGKESIELLKEADIVVTNPPFSLFREYVAQLVEYDKKFVIIGNKNAITFKEVFSLIKENKLWLGYRNINSDMWLWLPNEESEYEKIVDGKRLKHIMACWFTNLEHNKRHEKMILFRNYTPEAYPKYDNYDAINVDKVVDIPCDYDGVMGVPITFLDKYNPEQFELLGIMNTGETNEGIRYKNTPHGRPIINGKELYLRILIKNKHPESPIK